MPCRDTTPEEDLRDTQKKLDQATRLLCQLCSALQQSDPKFAKKMITGELRTWWRMHQKADRIRERMERVDRQREEIAQKARGKLTAQERRALGLGKK